MPGSGSFRLSQSPARYHHRLSAGGQPGEETVPGASTDTAPVDASLRTQPLPDEIDEAAFPGAGEEIGTFVVERTLGSGAMGVVLLARDRELQRQVAIKLLIPRHGDDERGQRRLLREAQSVAQLSHPNVVAVHQAGMHSGRVYVVMEYVDGGTLRQWVAARKRTVAEIVGAYRQAAAGLAAAHAAGFVHRDFKPDNVLIGSDGRVRVSDFGLVGATAEGLTSTGSEVVDVRLTQSGTLLGTPAYMAPEQFAGTDVDASADQFAFCVSLFEALHGRRPFPGGSPAELFIAMEEGKIAAPTDRSVPAAINRAILRGLAFETAARHPSMDVLAQALAEPPPRRIGRAIAIAVGVAALAIGGVWLFANSPAAMVTPCAPSRPVLPAAWDDDARGRLVASLGAAGISDAERIAARVDAVAHDYGARLWALGLDACTAPPADPEDAERQRHCVRLLEVQFDATIELAAEPSSLAIARDALPLLTELDPVDRCRDLPGLRQDDVPPPEAAAEGFYSARRRLLRANVARAVGDADTARTIASEVAEEARASGDDALRSIALRALALERLDAGRYGEAERHARDALVAARAGSHARAEWRAMLVVAGVLAARHAGVDEGVGLVAPAMAVAATCGERDSFEFEYRAAAVYEAAGKVDEADALVSATIDRALEEHAPARRVVQAYRLRAKIRSKRDDTARDDRKGAVDDARVAVTAAASGLGHGHAEHASALVDLARYQGTLTAYDDARRTFEEALAMLEADVGDNADRRGIAYMNLSDMERRLPGHERAEAAARRAVEVYENRPDREQQLATALILLGIAEYLGGDNDGAATAFARAWEIAERYRDSPSISSTHLLQTWGGVEVARGDFDRARELYRKAIERTIERHGSAHVSLALLHTTLGDVELTRLACKEAAAEYRRALAIRDQAGAADDIELVRILIGKSRCDALGGDLDTARDGIERVKKLMEAGMDPAGLHAPWLDMLEAEIRWLDGDRESARAHAERSAAAYAARGPGWRAWQDHATRWLADHPAAGG